MERTIEELTTEQFLAKQLGFTDNSFISYFNRFCGYDDVIKAMQSYANQQEELAVDKALTDLRLEMVSKMPEFSAHEKTGTKKHAEWIGFGNAITALDNFVLSLKPQILEELRNGN